MLDPLIGARFWSKVDIQFRDDCWPWLSALTPQGYGYIFINRKNRRATHIALILTGHARPVAPTGEPAICALHSCDSPICVNPRHLSWGTQKENTAQAFERGRRSGKAGTQHYGAKLTDDIVRQIRLSYESNSSIARRMGLVHQTISDLRRRKTWKHVA